MSGSWVRYAWRWGRGWTDVCNRLCDRNLLSDAGVSFTQGNRGTGSESCPCAFSQNGRVYLEKVMCPQNSVLFIGSGRKGSSQSLSRRGEGIFEDKILYKKAEPLSYHYICGHPVWNACEV